MPSVPKVNKEVEAFVKEETEKIEATLKTQKAQVDDGFTAQAKFNRKAEKFFTKLDKLTNSLDAL